MITAGQLYRLLTAVAPHADTTGDTVPALACVRIEVTPTDLLAIASDRYTLAVARHPLAAFPSCGPIVLALDDIADLRDLLLTDPDAVVEISRTDEDDYEEDRPEVVVHVGATEVVPAEAEGFPDWRAVLERALEADPQPVTQMVLHPHQLARLAAVPGIGTSAAALVFGGEHAPVVASVGDWFTAVITPVRTAAGYGTPFVQVPATARRAMRTAAVPA